MPTPASSLSDPRPLILTALLEPRAQAHFESLRRAHFPAGRNQVPAHITLFHQLPGSALEAVRGRLKRLCGATPPPALEVTGIKFTGQGVAYALRSPALEAARAELADGFDTLLIAQDRQGWRPHLTVQNKVDGTAAKRTFAELSSGFLPWNTRVVAVAMWRYLGGPWDPLGEVAFRGR